MKNLTPYFQIISCFFFALLGVQIKMSLVENNIENIVFYRSFFGAIILFLLILFRKEKCLIILKTQNIKIHLLRSFFGILAMYFGYKSLLYISLAQASTVGFSKVFFTCILASLIFSEKLDFKTVLLILTGFFGIILIANPGQINDSTGIYMSLFSAICVSGGIISISYLSKSEKTTTILFYHSILSTLVFLIIFFDQITFSFNSDLFNYVSLTINALLGQYFNTESYKDISTNKVVIQSYSRIIFSTIFGFFFFSEKIYLLNIVGIVIVIFTSFFVRRNS